MRAAVLFEAGQPFETRDVRIDRPAAQEVLVRVAASGLCHSDWHFATGDLPVVAPAVLGHEIAGIVEAVGEDVRSVVVGDHVVACASAFCGHCVQCVSGRTHTCAEKPRRAADEPSRLSLEGAPVTQGSNIAGFAEMALLHQNGLVRIDRAMPLDRAALLGCGVLTGLGAVFNAAEVRPGSRVVVIGCGGVGLNLLQGARMAGAAQIVAVDRSVEKEALAREFGATDFVPGDDDTVAAVRELTRGGADYAFEAIGLPQTIVDGVRMLATGGLMTIVGATRIDATLPLPAFGMIPNEWRIQGTYMGSSPFTREIPRFARFYLDGQLNLDSLISERIGLDDINNGFAAMLRGTQARDVITFDDVVAHAAARA